MDSKHNPPSLLRIAAIVIVVWVIGAALTWWAFDDLGKRGQFGDMFGVLNSLFSSLAFAGVLYTVFMQRIELVAQEKQNDLQRLEMQRQNELMATQLKATLDSLSFERQRELDRRKPDIQWLGTQRGGNSRSMLLINRGGTCNVKCLGLGDIKHSFSPSNRLFTDQQVSLGFSVSASSQISNSIEFVLALENDYGQEWHKRYLAKDDANPVEIPL